jgi:hypothetical protein
MTYSGMLRRVSPVKTDISEEYIASIISVTRICVVFLCSAIRLLFTANVLPSSPILVTLMIEAILSSETSVLTGATRRNIPDDGILQLLFWVKSELSSQELLSSNFLNRREM